MKYHGSKCLENLEEATAMIATAAEHLKNGAEFRYGIVETASDTLIGTFLIVPTSKTEAKIGYSIAKQYWRMGYGFESIMAMTKYLENLGYENLVAWVRKENTASIRLMEKMQFERTAQNGQPDFHLYGRRLNP